MSNNLAYGISQPLQNIFASPIAATRNPVATDVSYDIGQVWINTSTQAPYILCGYINGVPQWILLEAGGGAGVFASLTVTPGPTSLTGAFTVISGINAVNIAADASANAINIGTGAGVVKTIAIGGTGANVITIGNTQTAGSIALGAAMTTGTIALGGAQTTGTISIGGGVQTGTITIAGGTGVQTVNIANSTGIKTVDIATGAAANIVTIGSVTGAAQTTIQAGSDGLALIADSAGVISINQAGGTGATNIGNATGGTFVTGALNSTGTLSSATAITATAGNITATNGNVILTAATTYISLPGPVRIQSGAGAPAAGLAVEVGDMYINTTAASATTRIYVATAAGTWTNVTCAA
jgi:hypothetical protein